MDSVRLSMIYPDFSSTFDRMSEGYPKYTVRGPVPLLSPGGLNRRITSASGLVRNKSDISLASL